MSDTTPSGTFVHGPYEDVALALIALISKAMDGQPPEVRKELWQNYVEDVRGWRDFWKGIGSLLRPH